MMSKKKQLKIIIAGGGTGGHIYTGVALAEALEKKYAGCEILFVGTKYGLEKKIIPPLGYKIKYILVRGLKGKSLATTIYNLTLLPFGLIQSFALMFTFRPDIILGVGGYASGPVGFMGWLLNKYLVIVEQNSVPGITNKLLSNFADWAAVAYDSAAQILNCRTIKTGVPLRGKILNLKRERKSKEKTILILGGSQGARGINRAVTKSLKELAELKTPLRIIHQTGETDYSEVKKSYEGSGLNHEVLPYIENIAEYYKTADLAISRAGAITTAELISLKIPTIFIPLPGSIYNHQYHNAEELAREGRAVLINENEIGSNELAGKIEELLDNGGISEIEKNLENFKIKDPAEEIVTLAVSEATSGDGE